MQDIEILGVPASPYTRKMLALLRYRRIPYRVIWGSHIDPPANYPVPPVKLLPTIYMRTDAGQEALVDSTPIIDRLEGLYADRPVRPPDGVLRFLDRLIEDFADEWLTKAMFHYRWHFSQDAKHAGPLLAYGLDPQLDCSTAKSISDALSQRQVSRLPLVGSNDVTAPTIEASFQRLIGILDRIIERQGFILGARPSSADFALYGQLTQLGILDPTPAQLLVSISPRLRAWLDRMEDLSGHSTEPWLPTMSIPHHLGELLREIGRTYVPFLIANAHAAERGLTTFEATIDGLPWSQPVFPYQVKCLQALRQTRLDLHPDARHTLDTALADTGCNPLF